jgi:hypothetical protein
MLCDCLLVVLLYMCALKGGVLQWWSISFQNFYLVFLCLFGQLFLCIFCERGKRVLHLFIHHGTIFFFSFQFAFGHGCRIFFFFIWRLGFHLVWNFVVLFFCVGVHFLDGNDISLRVFVCCMNPSWLELTRLSARSNCSLFLSSLSLIR